MSAWGADKTTLWLIGGNEGSVGFSGPNALNPWSATTTTFTSGQSFIIGAKDDGSSFGPWLTTNSSTRPANLTRIVVDPNGDLIVVAGGVGDTGAVTLNGQEILGAADSVTILKATAANGSVAWKVPVVSGAFVPVVVAPDGVVSPATSTYSLTMFADADGTIPASFTGSGVAQMVASGAHRLYILGTVTGSADFNPGSKSDIEGNLPGIFITRFSY
jgi:hypothetical protein